MLVFLLVRVWLPGVLWLYGPGFFEPSPSRAGDVEVAYYTILYYAILCYTAPVQCGTLLYYTTLEHTSGAGSSSGVLKVCAPSGGGIYELFVGSSLIYS